MKQMKPGTFLSAAEAHFKEKYSQEATELRSKLNRAEAELARISESHNSVTQQATSAMARANSMLDQRLGGDWKEIGLVLTSALGGLALGYFVQKYIDLRAPVLALGGVGVAALGIAVERDWSVRSAFVIGGGMMAAGSTLFVFTTSDPAPVIAPVPRPGGSA